jgi:ribosomal protein S18 acetylase RimI-like enzyme
MIISKATLEDAETIAEHNLLLAIESEGEHIDFDTVLAGVRSVLHDESKGFYLVAKEQDQIIGQLMITYEWSDWRNETIWWVQSVYVSTKHRQESVFTSLMEEVQRRARQSQVSRLRLYVHHDNTNAINVYQHMQWHSGTYHLFEKNIK